MIPDKINQDLKQAMLSGDSGTVTTLRGLKSAIQYASVGRTGGEAPSEAEIISVLQKEAKKRQEAADLYKQGGNPEHQQKELAEKAIIKKYLPEQLSEDEINQAIDRAISEIGEPSRQNMGRLIGQVKQASAGKADGATIARLVQRRADIS